MTQDRHIKIIQTPEGTDSALLYLRLNSKQFSYTKADKLLCIIKAPNKEAVKKSHDKYGVKCEWIMEVIIYA
jgi:hypothetical protein